MEIENKISSQIFDKLRSKFSNVTLGDVDGESTVDPEEATFFNFDYTSKIGENYGNVTISVIDSVMKIYYSKNISSDLSGDELRDWYDFLKDMRKTAMANMLRFDAHDIGKPALNLSDIKSTATRMSSIGEGKMYGSSKSSYQKNGSAKIIVRHNQKVDEEKRGARSRKIESIFIETREGERFKMPFKSLPGTRAMVNHVNAGGKVYDEIGESISTLVSDISKLRPFIRSTKNNVFEDPTTAQMVESAKEYFKESKKTLSKLTGKRGYSVYAESYVATDETSDYDPATMTGRFSENIEGAMAVVHKAYKQSQNVISEDTVEESVYDEIMDSITDDLPNKPMNEPEPYESDEFSDWAEEMAHYEGVDEGIDWPEEKRDGDDYDDYYDNDEENDPHPYNESNLDESPSGAAIFARMAVSQIKSWIATNSKKRSNDPSNDKLIQGYIAAAYSELESRSNKVIESKATYSDYQSAFRSNSTSGMDDESDIKSMLKYLSKKGKEGNEKAARNAMKRMSEAKTKIDQAEGLQLKESISQLQRDAGILK